MQLASHYWQCGELDRRRGSPIRENKPSTGAIWTRREYAFLAVWALLALALFVAPPVARSCFPTGAEADTLLNSAWAAAAGIVGALVNVVSIQMNHQSIVERVKRGLAFEPGLGAVVAWFVYLGASLGAITINVGSVSAQLPAFAPSVVLGGIAGIIWDVVLGRIRARAEDLRSGA